MKEFFITITAVILLVASGINMVFADTEKSILKNLKEHVIVLSDQIGTRNHLYYDNLNEAADYITEEFQKLGYVVSKNVYDIDGKTYRNIIAESNLEHSLDEVVIVGAHYDSCYNPGADDNASGVAGMLEMARLLKDKKLKKPLRFIAFTNEEPPYFQTKKMGSYVYAKSLKEKNAKISAVIILEMLGYYSEEPDSQDYLPFLGFFYPDVANYIAIVGNFKSKRLVEDVKENFKKATDFPVESIVAPSGVPGLNFSDHWSFWKMGYKAVMITDTAFLRNENYHENTDTYDTLNYNKMAQVIKGLTYAVEKLTNNE